MLSLITLRRTITVTALALAVGAVVVPSAAANGDDGDRATSKPRIVVAPEGFGSMGDRATSRSPYGSVDTWYSYARSVSASAAAPEGFGSLGDRATSKPLYGPVDTWYQYAKSDTTSASAPEGFGSMGDRATSKSPYGPVDTWYQYAKSQGKSTPVLTIGPGLRAAPSDGFNWGDFAIGAAAMFGTFALLGVAGLGLRGARSGQTLRST